jgi:hypothetical protein
MQTGRARSRCARSRFGQSWLLLVFCRVIAFLHGVRLAHVLPVLGSPVPLGAFLMVDVRFRVDPDLTSSAAGSLSGLWRGQRLAGSRPSSRCRRSYRCSGGVCSLSRMPGPRARRRGCVFSRRGAYRLSSGRSFPGMSVMLRTWAGRRRLSVG